MSRIFHVLCLSFISLNVGRAAELYRANVSFSYVESGRAGTVWDYGIYLKRGSEVSTKSTRVDVSKDNFDSENCNLYDSCPSERNKTVSYAILCDNTQLTDLLSECSGYKIIIVCMDEHRLDDLIAEDPTFSALQAPTIPPALTIVALNQSDPDRLCALYRHDKPWGRDAVESFKVTIKSKGPIVIPKDPPKWPTDSTTSPLTFYFVMFAFCLLLMLAVIWFVFNYVKRCHQIVARRHQQVHEQTVTRRAINKCPVKAYKKSKLSGSSTEGSEDADRCSICLEDYKTKDSLRELPCKHLFHKQCVDPWLMDKRTCPLCKQNIVSGHQEQRGHTSMEIEMSRHSLETVVEVDEEAEITLSDPPADASGDVSIATLPQESENGD